MIRGTGQVSRLAGADWAVKVSPYRGLLLVGCQIRHSSNSDEMLTAVIADGGTLGHRRA
jgi:hypothetical protein